MKQPQPSIQETLQLLSQDPENKDLQKALKRKMRNKAKAARQAFLNKPSDVVVVKSPSLHHKAPKKRREILVNFSGPSKLQPKDRSKLSYRDQYCRSPRRLKTLAIREMLLEQGVIKPWKPNHTAKV